MPNKIKYYENNQMSGTTAYHSLTGIAEMFKFYGTDGVAHLSEEKKCYWINDVVGSYIPKIKRIIPAFGTFFVCYFVREVSPIAERPGCRFWIEDGNKHKIGIKQFIPYSDITVDLKLFLVYDGGNWVLMLPSEYLNEHFKL